MNPKPIRFYIRSILLLVVCFIFLQICSYFFVKSPVLVLHETQPLRSVWVRFRNGNTSELKRHMWKAGDGAANITRQIYEINNASVILNEKKFYAKDNDSVVVVVQVHQGIAKLKVLIKSLSRARGISKALLVFSHDFFDEAINECIQNIEFSRVLQLYYPHSIQSHPHNFPGTDPFDCPHNISFHKAVESNCRNARYPDIKGNYRESTLTERKHHWWWKANYLFDRHSQTKYHTGLFLFLDEDSIVLEDFLFVLKKMKALAGKSFPNCSVLCLGKKVNPIPYSKPHFSLTAWTSGERCNAIAFNRTTWSNIHDCASDFCTYDDHNWEKSLDYVTDKCLKHKLYVMNIQDPRVYSTAGWSKVDFLKANKLFSLAAKLYLLYPPKLTNSNIHDNSTVERASAAMSGGWADPRDHKLCLSMVKFKH